MVLKCSLFRFKLVSFFPQKPERIDDLGTRFALKDPHVINLQCLEKPLGRFDLIFDLDVGFNPLMFVHEYESYGLHDGVCERRLIWRISAKQYNLL